MSFDIFNPAYTDAVFDQMQERCMSQLVLDFEVDSSETNVSRTRAETQTSTYVVSSDIAGAIKEYCEAGFQDISLDYTTNKHTPVSLTSLLSMAMCSEIFELGQEVKKSIVGQNRQGVKRKYEEIEVNSQQITEITRTCTERSNEAIPQDLGDNTSSHTGNRHYQCDLRECASTRAYNLKNNKKIKIGKNPYKCDVCEYTSTKSSHLKGHMNIHIGETRKTYKCDVCEYASTQSCDLKTISVASYAQRVLRTWEVIKTLQK